VRRRNCGSPTSICYRVRCESHDRFQTSTDNWCGRRRRPMHSGRLRCLRSRRLPQHLPELSQTVLAAGGPRGWDRWSDPARPTSHRRQPGRRGWRERARRLQDAGALSGAHADHLQPPFDTHSAEVADRMQSAFSNPLAAPVRPETPSPVVDLWRSKAQKAI
jgi:hypothetical protein